MEALELASSPFGGALLGTIGREYIAQARANMGEMFVGVEQTGKSLSTKFSIASSSMRAAFATMDFQKSQKKQAAATATANAGASSSSSSAGGVAAGAAGTGTDTAAKSKMDAQLDEKMQKIGIHM